MEQLLQKIAAEKAELGRLRRLAPAGLGNFEHVQDIELTFASNAIEGNTLTAAETALVVEQGLTIGGKPLRDHLEAIDHYEAIRYVRDIARHTTALTEMDVRNLHRLVMLRSQPEIAGRYADQGRYVLTDTGRHTFPSPAEVPALMGDFVAWLGGAPGVPVTAFGAHRRLVDIHPFNDGNGRTAAVDEFGPDAWRLSPDRRSARGSSGLYRGITDGARGRRHRGFRAASVRAPARDFAGALGCRARGDTCPRTPRAARR